MLKKYFNTNAFSLLEVLLAAIIFVLSIGGVFVTLDSVRRPVLDKETALVASVYAKQVLETLRSQVGANLKYFTPCPSGGCINDLSLSLGTHKLDTATLNSLSLNWPNNTFSTVNSGFLTYNVSCADGSPNNACGPDMAHKVDLTINWPDAT